MSGEPLTAPDGVGRPINPESTDPAHVIAAALARYDGWGEIRPAHRYRANAILRALKEKALLVDRRTLRTRKSTR
jgi:hypothetical protein